MPGVVAFPLCRVRARRGGPPPPRLAGALDRAGVGLDAATSGAYRFVRHPNYLIVAGEMAILPLAFDAIAIAVLFSACNALLLARRVRFEHAAFGLPSYHIRETLPRRS